MYWISKLFIVALIAKAQSERIPELSCDFEEGSITDSAICNFLPARRFSPWVDRRTSSVSQLYPTSNWRINNGTARHSDRIDGPLGGVPGQGSFLQLIKQEGMLKSKPIRLSGKYCLSMDYYQFGPKGDTQIWTQLLVYAMNTSYTDTASDINYLRHHHYLLFSRYSILSEAFDSVDRWNHFQQTADFRDGEWEIYINAVNQITGTTAIDNFRFERGPCRENVNLNSKYCQLSAHLGSAHEYEPPCDWIQLRQGNPDIRYTYHMLGLRDNYAHGATLSADISSQPEVSFQFKKQDGRQCLSLKLSRSRASWKIVEKIVNRNTSITTELLNSDQVGHGKINIDVDPFVDLSIGLELIAGRFDINSIKKSKGLCPKPLHCEFRDGFCSYYERTHSQSGYPRYTWYVGRGRLQYPKGRENQHGGYADRYLYFDPTNMMRNDFNWAMDQKAIESDTNPVGGMFCYELKVLSEFERFNIWIQDVNDNFFDQRPPVIIVNDETSPWKFVYTQVNAKGPFKMSIVPNAGMKLEGFESLKIQSASLHPGSCQDLVNGTRVPRRFDNVHFMCHQTGHYIPAYRTCDGVIDCPMGEDEDEHCAGEICSHPGIHCKRRGISFCFDDTSRFCDGIQDYDDARDEDPRMCNSITFCENYCLHNGICSPLTFSCTCETGFIGKRCSQPIFI